MAAFLFCCCFSNSLYFSFFKFDYALPAALALDGLPVCGGATRAGVLDVSGSDRSAERDTQWQRRSCGYLAAEAERRRRSGGGRAAEGAELAEPWRRRRGDIDEAEKQRWRSQGGEVTEAVWRQRCSCG